MKSQGSSSTQNVINPAYCGNIKPVENATRRTIGRENCKTVCSQNDYKRHTEVNNKNSELHKRSI